MTTMDTHSSYERGYDAAQRALDRSTLTALDMLKDARRSEANYLAQEMHRLAEWSKGYADAVQEFLDDKAH